MFVRIRTKIVIVYLLFAIVIIGALGMLASYRVEKIFHENMDRSLTQNIDFITYYLSDISDKPTDSISIHLQNFARRSHLRITLIDSLGNVVMESEADNANEPHLQNHLSRPEIISARKYKVGSNIRMSSTTQQEYLYVAKQVTIPAQGNAYKNVEYIRVSIPLSYYNTTIQEIRSSIIVISLLVLILVFILSLFISKKMTDPIVKLTDEIRMIAGGNYNKILVVRSNDEIKMLIESINQLVEKINREMNELQKSSMIRSQFLANVSHELRTPLFSIQAFIETLLAGALEDSTVNEKYLKKALFHVERLNNLLNDLIDISRIESKELKLTFHSFPVIEFLLKIVETEKFSANQKGMTLILDLGADIKLFADKDRLSQVMYNLIDNAIRYNPSGTVIRVSYEVKDSFVTIYVNDNGSGIAKEHLPRLFERFYRVEKERSRETGGTGLGLAIVKHIVEAHNSNIFVESEVGKGTSFYFTLKI
jgi:two-component system, OmpR family, phosphate regulon sensor histidine kinase PhoR